jgi:hypothetical protein
LVEKATGRKSRATFLAKILTRFHKKITVYSILIYSVVIRLDYLKYFKEFTLSKVKFYTGIITKKTRRISRNSRCGTTCQLKATFYPLLRRRKLVARPLGPTKYTISQTKKFIADWGQRSAT